MLKINKLERKIKKQDEQLVLNALKYDDNIGRLNQNWSLKFDMMIRMFECAIKEAGTINEAKKWLNEWTADVKGIDPNIKDAGAQMDAIIEKHGFEFKATPINVSYNDMI